MAENTNIAWCDSTWNPWIGCTRISEGCSGCYAAVSIPARFLGVKWGPRAQRHRTSGSNWKKPLAWNQKAAETGKPWRVFCGSLCDVFDNEVPDDWRDGLWELIRLTSHLHWIIVTKRIGNAPSMLPTDWGDGWHNVWLLATICDQQDADRDIGKLLAVPAAVHGISYEPALGRVDWMPFLAHEYHGRPGSGDPCGVCGVLTNGMHHPYAVGLDWVIVGGESDQPGHRARTFDLLWARSTIDQCRTAGKPVFVKQLGSNASSNQEPLQLLDRAGADPTEWPPDLKLRKFPL